MSTPDTGTTARRVPAWRPAGFYETDGDRLKCTLCPFECSLADGEAGRCHVRRRTGAVLETSTFATSVTHLDAIERKPLYHFRPGARVLTLAAPGCTFRCNYCINSRLSQYGRPGGDGWDAAPADAATLVGEAVQADAMIGLSYTEPALALEFTQALARRAGPLGVPILWKSNGFLTASAARAAATVLAAVNIDIKAASEAQHRRLTGADLAPVFAALEIFLAAGVWVEVCTPVLPGATADDRDLAAIAARIAAIDTGIPWHLLRFSPTFRMTRHDPTTPERLRTARDIGYAEGLRHVYVERALGQDGRDTRCPGCGAAVVVRDIWRTEANLLRSGACPHCGRTMEGRW